MRKIDKIYIHHSESSPHTKIAEIRKWHVVDNGWKDIAYHYVIEYVGNVERGRQDEVVGAHTQGDNATSLGICVVGNFDDYVPNAQQFGALCGLVKRLCDKYSILPEHVLGHRDGPNVKKSCPGKFLYDMLPKIRSLI